MSEGLRVVLERGFIGASVRDIVVAAGVPQGSFSNHFVTKEAFGLELLERYAEKIEATLDATVRNSAFSPQEALTAYARRNRERLDAEGASCGCLSGNLSVEASHHSERIRLALMRIFDVMEAAVLQCFTRALALGTLPVGSDVASLARAYVGGLQGAIMMAKLRHSTEPLLCFERSIASFFVKTSEPSSAVSALAIAVASRAG
ncbi:TetR family transcriptional regulator [Herbaspirillum frisingense]|uniref:TetR family transcriptional regulator C-terminal domain-containing protein n=1 Tax=Herbaspirillum frisingense TaxID=92645 RepID=UPI0016047EAC|nr:TetR family transcriptional regulator C-terminal domain-containing protein [Herbaspirillum frisingense]QNB06725.1 TetR family transcriptional regulator [Herbaspirillum frisingense]